MTRSWSPESQLAVRDSERRKMALVPGIVTVDPALVEVIRAFDGTAGPYGAAYRQLAPVRTVVDFLSDAVATTPLKVYRRAPSGRPEVRDHPLSVLLRHPNPELTSRTLISGTVHDIAVYGDAYWRKVESGAQRWLVPLPPERVIPRGGDLLAPARYDFWNADGTETRIPRDEVVHFKLYNPEDRRVGASKLQSLRTVLAEEVEVSRHRAMFWRNAARREGVIERPVDAPDWDEESRERFRQDWRNRTSGEGNAGRTAILEEGMKWNPDSFSPKEAEFVEGRKLVLEATCRVYNVPVSLLGLTATATFASQKEFHSQLYRDTLPPWFELIQSEIELQLLPWFDSSADPDVYVEFAVESKLRGSFEEQAQVLSTAVGRPWMVVSEARKLQNLDERGDPTDDDIAIPTNNVTLQSPDGTQTTAPAPAPTPLRAVSEEAS